MPWIFNPMVDHLTSESHQVSTPDGGRCSDMSTTLLSSMIMERLWTCRKMLTWKTEMLKYKTFMENSTNNGMSSMLTNYQQSQRRESITANSDFLFKDHSTSSQKWVNTDTLIILATMLLSRQAMEETLKPGITIK
jgi:hypothetical protein